jgi:hypothetical protein
MEPPATRTVQNDGSEQSNIFVRLAARRQSLDGAPLFLRSHEGDT